MHCVPNRRGGPRNTHVEIFSYVYRVIRSSLALHNKHWISGEQSRKDTPTEKLCFQLLGFCFFSHPLCLILILLLSGLFSPKSRMPEGGSGSDSCGHRSPVTSDSSVFVSSFSLHLSVFLDSCCVHSQVRAAKTSADFQEESHL